MAAAHQIIRSAAMEAFYTDFSIERMRKRQGDSALSSEKKAAKKHPANRLGYKNKQFAPVT